MVETEWHAPCLIFDLCVWGESMSLDSHAFLELIIQFYNYKCKTSL